MRTIRAECRFCGTSVQTFGEVCADCLTGVHSTHRLDGPVSPECLDCGAADVSWNLWHACPHRYRTIKTLRPNFVGMGEDEDPDAYDRERDRRGTA
jgi:hypothetical protein